MRDVGCAKRWRCAPLENAGAALSLSRRRAQTMEHTRQPKQMARVHGRHQPQGIDRTGASNAAAEAPRSRNNRRTRGVARAEAPGARDDAAARAREGLEVARVRPRDTHDDDATSPLMVIDARVQAPEADLAERGERALPDDARDALGVVHLAEVATKVK